MDVLHGPVTIIETDGGFWEKEQKMMEVSVAILTPLRYCEYKRDECVKWAQLVYRGMSFCDFHGLKLEVDGEEIDFVDEEVEKRLKEV